MFDAALDIERNLHLNDWEEQCPKVEGMSFAVSDGIGGRSIDWAARLDNFAQSVDQRVKIPGWLGQFEKRGGRLIVKAVGLDDLSQCARTHDLVIVASGKGALGQLSERDASRS